MSGKGSGKSHAKIWVLVALVGLPLLYLLSVPPLYREAIYSGRYQRVENLPHWLTDCYGYPYTWLHVRTPLRKPLADYLHLWVPGLMLPTRLAGDP
jgi:hypothetical protein